MTKRRKRNPNRRPRYPTDLNDRRWNEIEALIPEPGAMGRPSEVNMRRVIDAVLYMTRAGCAWRLLPKNHFPPWETVYGYFRRWSDGRSLAENTRHAASAGAPEGRSA